MKLGSVTPTGIASAVGLIALTIGIFAGIAIVYLLPPVVALLSAVSLWSAWTESRLPDSEAPPPRRPGYWLLLALGYLVTTVVAITVAWVYFSY